MREKNFFLIVSPIALNSSFVHRSLSNFANQTGHPLCQMVGIV
jgi:hypothetical protein